MNARTAKLIAKATTKIDPNFIQGTVREQRRAWTKAPWTERHKMRLDLQSLLSQA